VGSTPIALSSTRSPRARPGPGQSQLYRLLTAYSHLDPEVGYTQGMNFLAALLLAVGLNEQVSVATRRGCVGERKGGLGITLSV